MSCYNTNKVLGSLTLTLTALISVHSLAEAKSFEDHGNVCWTAENYLFTKKNITQAEAEQIRKAQQTVLKVGSIPNIVPQLAICENDGPNAYVTNRNEPLRVTTGLLKLIGTDEGMLAAVLGHEIAHLQLNHVDQKREMAAVFEADGRRVAESVYMRNGNFEEAIVVYAVVKYGQASAYSRMFESEADDLGIQFSSKAGFDPDGAQRLFSAMFAATGFQQTSFLDDHPGILDRYHETSVRIQDEKFDQAASNFLSQQQWDRLETGVARWLEVLPKSPNAWYYSAKIDGRASKEKELYALENAFTFKTPSLSKLQPEIDQALLSMCSDLYMLGHIVESVHCSKDLNDVDKELFNKKTFKGYLLVSKQAPSSLNLNFVRKADGGKLITDGGWPERKPIENVTPAWKRIRYESAKLH